MKMVTRPKIFGTGLIALDVVMGVDPDTPVRCWTGGTCGNVLCILAGLGWEAYPIARMNGDAASERVRQDMARWGVHLDWAACEPVKHTPIIVQEIRRRQDGRPDHRFSWSCPHCGKWLPPFRAITMDAVDRIRPALVDVSVFFLDRLSRAALTLATDASADGAIVVFEPSGGADGNFVAEALTLAHVVKYADDRLSRIHGVMGKDSAVLLEVRTLGEGGLQYRHRLGRGVSDWIHLAAVPSSGLVDTCGAGDWCTAGLIAKAAVGGRTGLLGVGARGVRAALRHGQALAAWNCGFEGARGGMYAAAWESFRKRIPGVLKDEFEGIEEEVREAEWAGGVTCPACAPGVEVKC